MENTALGRAASDPYYVQFPPQINLANCYQCGKCTAGCPVSSRMELAPNQIIRIVQLGLTNTALCSQAIWECISCQTCSARCPKEVDCAGVMDVLREASLSYGMVSPAELPVASFQKAFLQNIRRNGRLNELELIARFKTDVVFHTGRLSFLFKDATLAPKLSKRKKLHFNPEKVHDRKVVDRIFARCSKQAGK